MKVYLLSSALWLPWFGGAVFALGAKGFSFLCIFRHSGNWHRDHKNWLSMSGYHLAFKRKWISGLWEDKTFSLEKGLYFICHETIATHSKSA